MTRAISRVLGTDVNNSYVGNHKISQDSLNENKANGKYDKIMAIAISSIYKQSAN